ncbi:HipA protein [hydrothermal vent metagenome]|uniref:HipA protein n=1 Tax=hydrothermal vent metagenome TaxID=652676 RepID=A0A3B0WSX8_9ZZZZ
MKDRSAVIWTRLGAQPVKMGMLVITDKEARFTYEAGYSETGLPGLSLVYPPDQFNSTIVRPRSEFFDLHPPLQSLVLAREERNFLRALLLKYLSKINVTPEPGFDTDWQLLMIAGHGGIGHLDVFESDSVANEWYSTPSKKGLIELDDKFGFSLKEFMTWYDGDSEEIISVIGPTPAVGGAIPKLPLSIEQSGWDGRVGLPTRFGDTGRTDILLKLENTAQYPGIIELEALGLTIHDEAGFDVPRFWPVTVKNLNALAIERFDRTKNGSTVYMESMYSILAAGNIKVNDHHSATYDFIGQAIDSTKVQLVSDRKEAKKHLLDRLILAMLTGNGDLHLNNLSIIEKEGQLAFSPVYDPVPMRAYKIHDELYPSEMGFGNYGEDVNGEMIGFKTAYLRFSKNLGISKTTLLNSVEHMLQVTDNYNKRIDDLDTLPKENKELLIKVHKNIREKFERL